MNQHTHVTNVHGNTNTNGGPLISNSRFDSGGGTIYIGHVRLRSTHVKIARRVLEVFEFMISTMALGITVSASEGMKHGLGFAKIPGKLSYNIGVAAVSMVFLLIVITFDYLLRPRWFGYDRTIREPWPKIAVNLLCMGLWVGTIPASFYTCSDLCSAAGSGIAQIRFATLYCTCPSSQFEYWSRALEIGGTEQRSGRYEATEALDILLTIFFMFSTGLLMASRLFKDQAASNHGQSAESNQDSQ